MGTARLICVSILVILMAILFAGCGGGGGSSSVPEGLGIIRGTVQEFPSDRAVRATADDITVSIDGTDISTLANADGSFVIEDVPVGLYTLVAQTQGRARALVVSVEAQKETNVGDVVLVDAGQISGLVTSASTHQPISGALVSVIDKAYDVDRQMPRPVRTCRTNGLGSYTISGLPAGDYVAIISKAGYRVVSRNLTVSAGATTPGDAALQPITAVGTGGIEGTAYLQKDSGEPVPIAGVMIGLTKSDVPVPASEGSGSSDPDSPPSPPFWGPFYIYTGEDGKYRLEGIEPGEYKIYAIRPGLEYQERSVKIVANEMQHADFIMSLVPPSIGTIEGTVTNSETGRPMAGALVSAVWDGESVSGDYGGSIVMPGDDTTQMRCTTDEQGHYRLVVPDQVTSIQARADGFEDTRVHVTVLPGAVIRVDIELHRYSGGDMPPPPPPGL